MSTPHVDEKAVFNAARQIGDAEAREGYLQVACRDDAEALGRIRELLRVNDQERSFLESPAVARAPEGPEPPIESAGSVIGHYKLLEQIGEGGFGVVFMAEQTAPVRRKVALKVLKPGMDTRQVIARFEAERQALALMDHPNIARVFDAGTTGTGRPYFVMELVRGVPITEYCDAHHLTPRQRLELFVTVCQAVQHAHQKGIIHRDIKPSNVLVTLHDDRPVAKVIDFGIAKAISGQLTDKTLFTGFAQLIGTPLYMSPEQASMSAIDVDTRSDIYSLGVLLYELLTGATPFAMARLQQAAFDEIRRIIREEEPEKPSTRLSTADALPTLAANRGTEPAKLTRLVRGELDWIVMKALEKDRSRRYETANGFAADVQRYLADEAVSACPPSATYRLRKFARRNKGALLTSALVGAMLLVVAGSLGWMALDGAARRVRNAAAVAVLLDQAEEALRAEAPDRAAIALEAAERRAADGGAEEHEGRLGRRRADLKLLQELNAIESFRWTVANNQPPSHQVSAARWRAALTDYGVASDSRVERAAGLVNGSPVRNRILSALDKWHLVEPSAGVRAVLRAADPDPYREALRDATAARDASAQIALAARPEALTQPPWFATAFGRAGGVPVDRRRAMLEAALRNRPGDLEVLMELCSSYDRLVRVGDKNQRAANGEWIRWTQAAVSAHPGNAVARVGLGLALSASGDSDGAIHSWEEAIRIDPTLTQAHINLGSEWFAKGDLVRSIACHEKAIGLEPDNAYAHFSLGAALGTQGDWALALPHLEKAVALDPKEAYSQSNLGTALMATGELDRALTHLRQAIQLDSTFAEAHYNLGLTLTATGDPDGALASYRKAIGLDQTNAHFHYALGCALAGRDQAGAEAAFRKAIELKPDHAEACCDLGASLCGHGHFGEAVEFLRKGHELGRRRPNWAYPSDRLLQQAERLLALESKLPDALAGQAKTPAEHLDFADLCACKQRYADAVSLYGKAFAAEPSLADLPENRYHAAGAALLAAGGQEVGAEEIGASDKARLRGLALDWLGADLASRSKRLADDPASGPMVHWELQHWLKDTDLGGVRDDPNLAGLPDEERERWTKLWNDVRELMARAVKK